MSTTMRASDPAVPATRPVRVFHFISDSYSTEYFRLMARYTDRSRFEIQVASLRSAGGLQNGLAEVGIPTFALGAESRWAYPAAAAKLAVWLRRRRVDVVHAHLFEASVVGLLAARAAGVKVRVFTGHHSHEVPLHNRRALFEVDRFVACRLANVVVAPSREMGDTFVEKYGCDSAHLHVIEHGLDLARFDPETANREGVRAELGLTDQIVFGAISKHFWVKNLDALVRAFADVATTHPNAHLVILGVGDSSRLADLVAQFNLSSRVSILPRRRDVPDVLAAFDVFVHPALAESFGFAIVEAMAMAKPVAATRVGIARDVIDDGLSGIEIGGTDPASVRDAMLRAVTIRDQWPALGAEARRRVLMFTPERWVRNHERLYLNTLALAR